MPGRLALDFGTSNTVVAVWDDAQHEGVPLHVPDYGYFYQQSNEKISVIPSVIHYAADRCRWVGNQVLQQNLYQSDRTFRWMKRYIANRSPVQRHLDGKQISHFDAGRDFLSSVLLFTSQQLNLGNEEIALTVPVEAFEHYENWLTDVAAAAGLPRFRLIDEPSAAALGYGARIRPGDVYLIFDFGGGTLDVAVVLIEEEEQVRAGRRCRVLGKAGADIGGATIDQWLFQAVLQKNKRNDTDDEVRKLSRALLVECELAKERLSASDRSEIIVVNPQTGTAISAEIARSQFEDLLEEREAFSQIDRTIRRSLNTVRTRGYEENDIKAVLMVGGTSQIPAVQRTVRQIFGRDRVMIERPLDAVARGAAAFVAGVDFYDSIQHDYAIRHLNREKDDYDYLILVKRGTPYPTSQPLAKLTVKATYNGQTKLGIPIFEIGEQGLLARTNGKSHGYGRSHSQPVELVFDTAGAARLVAIAPSESERRTYFWMNETSPTFLLANPPAQQGERRFEIEFSIDGNKRLLIAARDLKTGQITHRDYPVVKLT